MDNYTVFVMMQLNYVYRILKNSLKKPKENQSFKLFGLYYLVLEQL